MNGAIKYFREHGLKKSKKHLLDIREAANQVSWVHSLEGFSQDLKRLVESWELVEECGGLAKAKERVSREEGLPNPNVFYVLVVSSAIDDVESCKESFHERQNP